MSVAEFIQAHGTSGEPRALVVDAVSREVHLEGELVDLTRTEFDLLAIFERNPRRVLTPEMLLSWLWGADCVPDSHPLEVYIHRLRTKLGESGRRPRFIHNVRGVGYRFEPQARKHKHHAVLEYDSGAVLQSAETTDRTVWGWEPSEIVGTRFLPTRTPVFRNRQFINLLNRICEAAGIESMKLTPTVVTKDGHSLQVEVVMHCRYEGSRLTGMRVEATWFD